MVEDGDSITASVTTNDADFTVVSRTFTPTGGTGAQNITVTKTDNSVSADITAEMQTTGGEISIVVACESDPTQTATITYTVVKVYTINLADLSQDGNTVTGAVTTNNTSFTVVATSNGAEIDDSKITKTDSSVSVDVTGYTANDVISITVTCDTDNTKSATKTITLV